MKDPEDEYDKWFWRVWLVMFILYMIVCGAIIIDGEFF